ncbi:SWIM zinc finger family protein [Tundrisphaera lichenicola]|uniref:SWIM zinc finger family protein n=1 Tax=Tundrisphaera lichenicola TaxID=2029860 RepID=UPI003EBD9728
MWNNWGRFKPSKPRPAKGGIKAQSKKGQFGQSWWARRWIAVLEGFDIGARLGRGRSYARSGQVLEVNIGKGLVRAKVQGSRPKPYEVTIQARTIPPRDWETLGKALATRAIFAAKLFAGEMPPDIEKVFEEAKLSLFPTQLGDLQTKCSCPDWSNPCKHIAAVYYLLGEEFDRDPFLIFTLRGLARDELIELLGRSGAVAQPPVAEVAPSPPEPLSSDLSTFWGGPKATEDEPAEIEPPSVAAALPRRLGGFPFWRGGEPFLQAIEPTYTRATPRGLDTVLGQASPMAPPGKAPTARKGPARKSIAKKAVARKRPRA